MVGRGWRPISLLHHFPIVSALAVVYAPALHRLLLHGHHPGSRTIFAFSYDVTATTGVVATVVFIYFNHRENVVKLIR